MTNTIKSDNYSWVKLKATNFTGSFGTLKSTKTKPSGNGVIELAPDGGGLVALAIMLKFFGTDANDETFKVRVWGWDRLEQSDGTFSWENALLAEFSCTLGNLAGTAGCGITATDFEVDTITLTEGDATISSNGADIRGAFAIIGNCGFKLLQIEFDDDSSAATMNALYRKL